jgi:hypothetical protein
LFISRDLFLPVGQELAELLELAGHLEAILGEEALDRIPEAGVADPVRAVGRDRRVAALELVGALGAGLDPGEAALDRELDRLVVAGLEVEKLELLPAAPDPAVDGAFVIQAWARTEGRRRSICWPRRARNMSSAASERWLGRIGNLPDLNMGLPSRQPAERSRARARSPGSGRATSPRMNQK